MNSESLKLHWHIAKGKLRQRFPELTDEDLAFDGNEEELFHRIEQRTRQTREELEFFFEIECGCVDCTPTVRGGDAARRRGPPGFGRRDARTAAVGEVPRQRDAAFEGRSRKAPMPPIRRPAPQEQASDSLAQEEERSTGMSGQSGGV